jgi:tetratricopeptide (TPR) repeat protein
MRRIQKLKSARLLLLLPITAIVGVLMLGGYGIFRERRGTQPMPAAASTTAANDPATAALQRGDAAFDQGNFDAAIEAYSDAIVRNPNFAEAYNNRGLANYLAGHPTDALADLNRALSLRPNYVNAITNRAIARFDQGDYATVIADATRAIELDPNDDSAFMFRGNAYQREGDYTRALADWLKANSIRMSRIVKSRGDNND